MFFNWRKILPLAGGGLYDGTSAGAGGVGYGARGTGITNSKNNCKNFLDKSLLSNNGLLSLFVDVLSDLD